MPGQYDVDYIYIFFCLKKNIVYNFVKTHASLSRNKIVNKYNPSNVLMYTDCRHLKHVKKRLKTPESGSLTCMDPFQKSAGLQKTPKQPVELQMVH